MLRTAVAVVAALSAAALVWWAPSGGGGPSYTAAGELLLPADVERWVTVGSSVGLGYSGREAGAEGEMFHTVLLEPDAYDTYRRSGRFPDGTMLALVIRLPAKQVAPARSGRVAGALAAVEMAVKDSARFAGKWAYFDFGLRGAGASARAQPRQSCQACHAQHGAHDNVFVQFYPVLGE
jgi:hypothetical protein